MVVLVRRRIWASELVAASGELMRESVDSLVWVVHRVGLVDDYDYWYYWNKLA